MAGEDGGVGMGGDGDDTVAAAAAEQQRRAAAKERQMAGLRKKKRGKRKFSRVLQGTKGTDKKKILFDYASYRERTNNPDASRQQEIRAQLGVTKQHSPSKSEVKVRLASALAENDMQGKTIGRLKNEKEKTIKTIQDLKDELQAMSVQLRLEREKSRITISKLVEDAETSMLDAESIRRSVRAEGKRRELEAEASMKALKEKCRQEVREERQWTSREKDRCEFLFLYVLFVEPRQYHKLFTFPSSDPSPPSQCSEGKAQCPAEKVGGGEGRCCSPEYSNWYRYRTANFYPILT